MQLDDLPLKEVVKLEDPGSAPYLDPGRVWNLVFEPVEKGGNDVECLLGAQLARDEGAGHPSLQEPTMPLLALGRCHRALATRATHGLTLSRQPSRDKPGLPASRALPGHH
jgi:hypothetical protein